MKHDPNEDIKHKYDLIYLIVSVLLNRRVKDLERIYFGNVHCEQYPYNRERIKKELEWALDYWLSKRQPVQTTFLKRCDSCEFNGTCRRRLTSMGA